MKFKWYGPGVVDCVHGPQVFEARSKVSGQTERAHAERVRYFRDCKRRAMLSEEERAIEENTEVRYEVVKMFVDIGKND